VLIEDDVEIGPLATVDAGTLAPTILRRGTRLDAHVHVGHNASLGPSAMVAAQSGFAGSVEIGADVRVGGQAGVADHVRVGSGAQIAAKSGVIGDVAPGQVVAGYPAVDRRRWLRGMARLLRRENQRK
jgi:UDP-3-O-[3-hydroxymyristoyl] glucosamine N-acyltransferase